MNSDSINRIVDVSSAYPGTELLAALAASRHLPERKRDASVVQRMEELAKQRRMHTMIRKNACPICGSKLNRGKKDSKNDYKRKWTCTSCKSEYTI